MFPAFIIADETGRLVNSLLGVKILDSSFYFFLFRGIIFTLSAIVSSGDDFYVFLNISIRLIISLIDLLSFEYFFRILALSLLQYFFAVQQRYLNQVNNQANRV